MATENLDMDYSKYDFKDSTEMYVHLSKKGLTKDTVREISQLKEEPEWMLDFRNSRSREKVSCRSWRTI